ncbi:hypothetical protein V7S43_004340 [Phytophthora oleae]|uniref:Uncharacterized protein n=1 Tax=Phytophthora oleae TaxID=2107226 RepID=A0ABD3FY75_9STRA
MEKSEHKAVLMLAPLSKVSSLHLPACDHEKLRADLSAYIYFSGRLRERRKEIYEADRCGTLKDRQAVTLSVEVGKWKRASDRMRLLVCEQLRALINSNLDTTTSNELQTDSSSEMIVQCTELLHSITITAIKEEIFEKERLQSNLRLHGKSAVYVVMRSRWRVRPRSW